MLNGKQKKTIYIIDGYGFIFRAFYALPNLSTSNGEPIGAVYGFFKMLISLINLSKPEYMVVALDTGKRTFRNDIYDEYVENQAIKELFLDNKIKQKFENYGINSEEDLKDFSVLELTNKLQVGQNEIEAICENYGLDKHRVPKMLIILLFLGMTDGLKIEQCKTQYKANRRETPDELKHQFKIIRELIDAMNIKTESSVGFEADDVISSIAKQAVGNGYDVVVISADKDLCQLVQDGYVSVYDPMKKKFLNEQGVVEKFGVRPDQVCDYLSIVGDHCDNIFGVNGVGPKGAVKLLGKYGHLENLWLHMHELDESTRKKFLNSKDVLELAYKLVKLRYDAVKVDDFSKYLVNMNHNGLNAFMQKYNFKTIDGKQRQNYKKYKNKLTTPDSVVGKGENNNNGKQGTLF